MASKGELSHKQILETANTIILTVGIAKLSHSTIAERLNMSKSAVHWHFPTKRDLLTSLVHNYVDHLKSEEERHLAPFLSIGLTREQAILPCMRLWYLDFKLNKRGWIGIGSALLSLSTADPELVEPIRAWYRDLYMRISHSGLRVLPSFVAMMVFDGFFNASKLGIMTLTPKETDAMQLYVLNEAFKEHPELLHKVHAVLGEVMERELQLPQA